VRAVACDRDDDVPGKSDRAEGQYKEMVGRWELLLATALSSDDEPETPGIPNRDAGG
jgi:hypothetical protein